MKLPTNTARSPKRTDLYALVLEHVDDIVMLADTSPENRIFYMNQAARSAFEQYRTVLNENLHGADVANVMGNSIHQFHVNPGRIRAVLESMKRGEITSHEADIPIGEVHLRTKTYPIYSRSDPSQVECYMACWQNVTAEFKLREITEISDHESSQLADRVNSMAGAVEEMSVSIAEVAHNATSSSTLAISVSETAELGSATVTALAEAATETVAAVRNSSEMVSELGRRTTEIGQIVESITAIADQTNLLALNAAIEAARAGAAGRGFAVVADEVRTLATKARSAADEITSRISEIQSHTQMITSDIIATRDRMEEGGRRSVDAHEALRQIVSEIVEVRDAITQIAAATVEQGAVANQIAKDLATLVLVDAESSSPDQHRTDPVIRDRFGSTYRSDVRP